MAKIRYYSGYDWKDISPEDIGAVSPDIIKQGENDPNKDTTIPPETKLYIQNSSSNVDNQTVIRVNDSITLPLPIDQGGTGGTSKSDALANLGLDYISILQAVYPIGSIYISTVSTNPSTLFGFGTWDPIPGRFLVGIGNNGASGNEALTVTSTNMSGGIAQHAHTTQTITLSADQCAVAAHTHTPGTYSIANHNHTLPNSAIVYSANFKNSAHALTGSGNFGTGTSLTSSQKLDTASASLSIKNNSGSTSVAAKKGHTHGNTGSSSNLPPYLGVYIWKRRA